ncbi:MULTISPECIES: hypothetical protein [Haloferax]|uniref:Uncharacterized protein n=2 Tax=Haloferax TaxID=2251 RepID=A0A6G1YYC8_9EURY|nr:MULTISPECIES: hypothetical protein [Haloferax]KAB1186618.1 hypothetical protein Hfx1149_00645 [Haloferax sp. CBA1149]MRW79235.1 hypothetical protein [Haloferax marinisediminis]
MSTDTTQRVGSIVERTELGHELVVVTEWRASTTDSLADLAAFDHDRRRFWRCTECRQEHASKDAFDAVCIASRPTNN